jgi:hypothetical protein
VNPGHKTPKSPKEKDMNTSRNTHTRPTTRYSIDAESARWWWPSAAAGAAATLAVVTIVGSSAAGHAIPIDPDRYHASDGAQGPTGLTPRHQPRTTAGASAQDSPEIPPGFRQCFMWQTHWTEAFFGGPQPFCPLDPPDGNVGDDQDGRGAGGNHSTGRGAAAAEDLAGFSLHLTASGKLIPIP